MQFNHWSLPGRARYFDVDPPHAPPPSGAERFHYSFLRRETRRERLGEIVASAAIGRFRECEDSPLEARAEAFERAAHSRDLHEVGADGNNHSESVPAPIGSLQEDMFEPGKNC